MVPKSGIPLPSSRQILSDSALAAQISKALRDELGSSRRATKTVMRWTGVCDKTARNWLSGRASPSGLHLIHLATNSTSVMFVVLQLTGHADARLGLSLERVEDWLAQSLSQVRELRRSKS